jgi:DNA polymerase delta subunit 2
MTRDREYPSISRSHSSYHPLQTFELEKEKHYQQQYADIYFLRLARLKPAVEEVAAEVWADFEVRTQ